MNKILIYTKILFLDTFKSGSFLFWVILFPIFMSVLLGSMFSIVYSSNDNDIHYKYSYYITPESDYEFVLDYLDDDTFTLTKATSEEQAKLLAQENKLNGYLIIDSTFNIHSDNYYYLSAYIEQINSIIKVNTYNQMGISVSDKVVNVDKSYKEASSFDVMTYGMAFLAVFHLITVAVSFTKLKKSLTIYRTTLSTKLIDYNIAMGIVIVISSLITFYIVALFGKYAFGANSDVNLFSINIIILVMILSLFTTCVSFIVKDEKMASSILTPLGFLSGIYMPLFRDLTFFKYVIKVNPLAQMVVYFDEKYYDVSLSYTKYNITIMQIFLTTIAWVVVVIIINKMLGGRKNVHTN